MLVLFFKIFICSILSDSMAVKTPEDFNYKFNDNGELKEINENGDVTDVGFKFEVLKESSRTKRGMRRLGR